MWIPYDEKYAVSVHGEVMNTETGKILRKEEIHDGYYRVNLYRKKKSLHRLVGLCFLPRIEQEGLQIDHINGDPKDNRACNLRWVTQSVNQRCKHNTKNLYYLRSKNLWSVSFMKDGKNIYRKSFKTIEEATEARDAFKNSEEYRASFQV